MTPISSPRLVTTEHRIALATSVGAYLLIAILVSTIHGLAIMAVTWKTMDLLLDYPAKLDRRRKIRRTTIGLLLATLETLSLFLLNRFLPGTSDLLAVIIMMAIATIIALVMLRDLLRQISNVE